MHGKSEGQFII